MIAFPHEPITKYFLEKKLSMWQRGGIGIHRRLKISRLSRLAGSSPAVATISSEKYSMQTFLPYPSFLESIQCLDNKRLGKQRVEAAQILDVLEGRTQAWKNHPAVKMWRGYENALRHYFNGCVFEWMRRGFKNTMEPLSTSWDLKLPPWIGDSIFHDSHKSKLLQKDPIHYGKFGWNVRRDLSYWWPV